MQGKGSSKIMDTQIMSGDMKSIPKPGDKANGAVTIVNAYNYPIVVTATNAFWGMISSANILPGQSVEMPVAACAAVDLYCWHGNASGVNWEGTYPVFAMHAHEMLSTIWVGQTATFGAQTAVSAAR
jgi:hypothetical protein